MARCFVIQPFDAGQFDKRYEEVLKPAIVAADLEPYRVDLDSKADVPIEAIEGGIRDAAVCLADISTNNPNVWYELGYAFAVGKPVVMVCSKEREKYPFDIQHRAVISYVAEAPTDFTTLQHKITERLNAGVKKGETIQQRAEAETVAPVAGLTQHEVTVLSILAGEVGRTDGLVSNYAIQQDTERAGLTKLGFTVAIRRLLTKAFVRQTMDRDENNDYAYHALGVTDAGWNWIVANEDKFILQRPSKKSVQYLGEIESADDDPILKRLNTE
jgi:nucleoside 2-deoxyribosyltransferase